MNIKYTKHAEDMTEERAIPRSMVEKAIKEPDGQETDKNGLVHFFKKRNGKVLRVVTSRENNSYIVITTYYDRRLKA